MKNLLELSKKNIPSYGIYITMQDPQIIEMAKCAGYDFGRLDAEHVTFRLRRWRKCFVWQDFWIFRFRSV